MAANYSHLMCVMMKPRKLELTPQRVAEGKPPRTRIQHFPGIFSHCRLPGRPVGGGHGQAVGPRAAPRLLLSTDQLQCRQASVTCDSQCQFHARGNHLRKSRAGFTFDKKSAAFVFVKRPITECDRSQRLPASADGPSGVCQGPASIYFKWVPPAAPLKLGRENKLSVSIYSCTSWKYRGF